MTEDWKWMAKEDVLVSFPFGARLIFRDKLLVLGRVATPSLFCQKKSPHDSGTVLSRLLWSQSCAKFSPNHIMTDGYLAAWWLSLSSEIWIWNSDPPKMELWTNKKFCSGDESFLSRHVQKPCSFLLCFFLPSVWSFYPNPSHLQVSLKKQNPN